ncbi:MAG: MarR family transcriptional regulator [Acidobacteriota bacterium]
MSTLRHELRQSKPFGTPAEEAFLALARTAGMLDQELARRLKAHGLTPTQYNALRILRGAHPETLTCGEVGERMVTPLPDVTRLVDRLERAGWARRERAKDDRRVVRVAVTDEGLDLLAALDGPVLQWMEEFLGHLPKAEIRTLIRLLEAVRREE